MTDLNQAVASACGWLTVPDAEHDLTLAMQAYEVIKERGWRMDDCYDNAIGQWCVSLRRDECFADGIGPTFASALCRAVVEASKRGER